MHSVIMNTSSPLPQCQCFVLMCVQSSVLLFEWIKLTYKLKTVKSAKMPFKEFEKNSFLISLGNFA